MKKWFIIMGFLYLLMNPLYINAEELKPVTMGLKPVFDYEIIPQKSHIIIDGEGYIPSAKKVMYIRGRELTEGFEVIDSKGRQVFKGALSRVSKDGESLLYMGDFSSIIVEGAYRIFQPEVGYSDEFAIDGDTYTSVGREITGVVLNHSFEDEDMWMSTLAYMLLIKEIYPDILLLENRDVREEMEYFQEELNALFEIRREMEPYQQVYLAGVAGQYCYAYRTQDPQFFNSAAGIAHNSFAAAEGKLQDIPGELLYYAAAQLYRISGYAKYINIINKFDNNQLLQDKDIAFEDSRHKYTKSMAYDHILLGDLGYLRTNYRTDYKRCEDTFNSYVAAASQIAGATDKRNYYIDEEAADIDLIDKAVLLGVVSYVLTSHEYASIESNYLHYLLGLNGERTNILDDIRAVKDGTLEDSTILKLAKLMLVISSNMEGE